MQVENVTSPKPAERVTIPLKRGKLKTWLLVPWQTMVLFEDGRVVQRWDVWLN